MPEIVGSFEITATPVSCKEKGASEAKQLLKTPMAAHLYACSRAARCTVSDRPGAPRRQPEELHNYLPPKTLQKKLEPRCLPKLHFHRVTHESPKVSASGIGQTASCTGSWPGMIRLSPSPIQTTVLHKASPPFRSLQAPAERKEPVSPCRHGSALSRVFAGHGSGALLLRAELSILAASSRNST